MPIPSVQAHDVVLAYLGWQFRQQLGDWVRLDDLAPPVLSFLARQRSPGFECNPTPPERARAALRRAIASLERKDFVRYDQEKNLIRLTGLGAHVSMFQQLPDELDQPASASPAMRAHV